MKEIRLWLPPASRRASGAWALGLLLVACGGEGFDTNPAEDGGGLLDSPTSGRDGGVTGTTPHESATDGLTDSGHLANDGGGTGRLVDAAGVLPSTASPSSRPAFVSTVSAVGSGSSTEHHLTLWVGTPGPLGAGASTTGAHVLHLSPISAAR